MQVQVELLGRFSVTVDGRTVPDSAWRRARSRALVKLLALSDRHRMHEEQLIEALWPDLPLEDPGASLRKAVHFARRALGSRDAIGFDHDVVALAPDSELSVDAEAYEQEARAALRTSDPAVLVRVAGRYSGELLPEDPYVSWTEEPRARLRALHLEVLRAAELWDRVLTLDPTDEEAQRHVMEAALRAGNRGEVIRQFQSLRERLRIDLGVSPARATVALYEQALEVTSVEPPEVTDRVRAALAWGMIHLHSGEFAKADTIAREARLLAIEAKLPREVGEASALVGMVANMQGRWPELLRSEFVTWIREAPAFGAQSFDAQLCLAEFCLCGAGGHGEVAAAAGELLAVAKRQASLPGQALATLILGEAELIEGRLDAASDLLGEAERLHDAAGAEGGRVLALQRLAEATLGRGQAYRGRRLVKKGLQLAESNWLAPHLLLRLQALAVQAAESRTKAVEAIVEGDRWLAERSMCQPCSMDFRIASAIALSGAGEIDQARRRLDDTERLAGMWNGGPWLAAMQEARGVQRRAEGDEDRAAGLLREAAARYGELGRPRDRERCLVRASNRERGAAARRRRQ